VVDGDSVVLTPTEYRLLATLARHQGQVLSPDQLIELAWDDPSGLAPRGQVRRAPAPAQAGLGRGDDTPIETVRVSATGTALGCGDRPAPDQSRPFWASRAADARNCPAHRLLGLHARPVAGVRPGRDRHRLIAVIPFPHDARREISLAGVLFFVLVAAAFLLPWERLPDWAWLIIPVGYIAVIAIIRDAQGGSDTGLVAVYLLPIVWLSLYGRRLHLLVGLFCLDLALLVPCSWSGRRSTRRSSGGRSS